jgi:hypothetical protein
MIKINDNNKTADCCSDVFDITRSFSAQRTAIITRFVATLVNYMF